MKIVPALATATLVAGSVVALSSPASAALVTYCSGTAADATVPGDLVIRANQSCSLTNVNVNGAVRIQQGADLVATGGTFSGAVVLNPNSYLDVTGTTIAGAVTNRGGYGLFAESAAFGAGITTRPGTGDAPFVFTVDTTVAGNVSSTGAETLLDGTAVAGSVTGAAGSYTDLFDSVVDGGLTVSGQEFGATVCESEIYGNASYTGNAYGVQLGTTGPLADCEGVSVWGGNVTISNNTGGVQVSGNIVRGDLAGEGNDPAPVGENNRVRGAVSGQFAELAAPDASNARMMRVDRAGQLALDAQTRGDAAVAEATAAGRAF